MARIGLVLGAGGLVGLAYHGGVLAALEESTGWDPRTADLIVGTSAGSVTASLLRAGVSASDLAALSESRPLSGAGTHINERSALHNPRAALADFLGLRPPGDPQAVVKAATRPWSTRPAALFAALLPSGAVSTEAISAGVDGFYAGSWPAGTWICAVRLRDGHRVAFGREGAPRVSIGEAVAASCAIPGYFKPVSIGRDRYVDGGVRSMVNLPLLEGLNLDLVVVSAPMAAASAWPPLAADGLVRHSFRAQLDREVAALKARGTSVLSLLPTRRMGQWMGLNAMDGRRRAAISRQARLTTARYLERSGAGSMLAELAADATLDLKVV